MKKILCASLVAFPMLLLSACASQFAVIAPQTCAEATALKNICSHLEASGERIVTDSLYNQGAALIRTGKNERANSVLMRVIINYRLILVRHAIHGKEREIEFLKRELAEDLREISTCRQILDQLAPAERP